MKSFNPETDLKFERTIDLTPAQLFAGWTTPSLLMKWFTPAPWKTIDAAIDLKPGGKFYTLMQSPEGQSFPNTGCYLEVEKDHKIVWTSALSSDFRPTSDDSPASFPITVHVIFEKEAQGTKYTAYALHKNAEDKKKHEAMGFETGWGLAFDQLVKLMKEI